MAGSKQKFLEIVRVFDAPVEKVWNAWTDPELVKKWWGPNGFTAPHIKIDFRVGGKYLYCMRGNGPVGKKDYWSCGEYLEIKPLKKIVASDSLSDEFGNPVPPAITGWVSKRELCLK